MHDNLPICKQMEKQDLFSNIPKSIELLLHRKLHNQSNHPIEIIKRNIYAYFQTSPKYKFTTFDNLDPVVTVEDNFDNLLIPKDHPARSKSDTYYVNENEVLRTHTSAHQVSLLKAGHTSFLVTGDVYRKDEIDARHYHVFHQMEMLTLIEDSVDPESELKEILIGLVDHLFPGCIYRFNKDYFPFTDPSYEIEVFHDNKWLEILGCGVVQPKILENCGIVNKKAIAFGIGLDRLVMIFCQLPDIRYIWSTHERFLNQFSEGKLVKFKPYSELPAQFRDISFFIDAKRLEIDTATNKQLKWHDENDFFECVREHGTEILAEVKLLDSFYNKKANKYSRTYRCLYSPTDPENDSPSELYKIVNTIHDNIRDKVAQSLNVILR